MYRSLNMNPTLCLSVCILAGLYVTQSSAIYSSRCGRGWQSYGSNTGCYILNKEPLSFDDAQDFCEKQGGNLVTINDPYEAYLMRMVTLRMNAWLGYIKYDPDDSYTWVDGDPSTFSDWAPGKPSGDEYNDMCAHFWKEALGRWADAPCSTTFISVCEKGSL